MKVIPGAVKIEDAAVFGEKRDAKGTNAGIKAQAIEQELPTRGVQFSI